MQDFSLEQIAALRYTDIYIQILEFTEGKTLHLSAKIKQKCQWLYN